MSKIEFIGGDIMSSLGERVKQVRIENKYNQAEFADELGISRSHLSGIEKNNVNPSPVLIKFLCLKFSINEDWILTGDKSKQSVSWNIATDEGCRVKSEHMSLHYENMLNNREGIFLQNTVEAYSRFMSLLSYPVEFKDENKRNREMFLIQEIIKSFELVLSSCKFFGVDSHVLNNIGEVHNNLIEITKLYEK